MGVRLIALGLAGLLLAGAGAARAADPYPTRPVHWVVPFPPGGATDVVARIMARWLSEHLGQQVVIDNRGGAGGNIATQSVINAPPDGYTFLLVPTSSAINATLYDSLPFNFLKDIAPVGGLVRSPNVMEVNLAVPAKTVAEFITYAKANPRKINMSSPGIGTSVHLSGELFMVMTGVQMTHVPYRGGAPALTDLMGGQVQVMFDVLPGSLAHIRAGDVRPLAVTTSTRADALPDVPTVAETVPGYEASTWFGVGMPKGAPPEIIAKLNAVINAGLADPTVRARFAEVGSDPMPMSPAAFGALVAAETEKWAKVVKASGAKAE
ncbi:MAG TPA: tripartite tricarboxylate transporter substrate binding protein [Xanthobacteraceae bacterium]|nr:tripartite tricarboxylate transporter substrate binding protein [Xanthobacteraceae bacterium]